MARTRTTPPAPAELLTGEQITPTPPQEAQVYDPGLTKQEAALVMELLRRVNINAMEAFAFCQLWARLETITVVGK